MAFTLQGFTNTEFERGANTTLMKYIADTEQAVLRQYAFGALLESRGRIVYNQAGRGFGWNVRWKMHRMVGNTGTTPSNFTPINPYKWCELEYRGYEATDMITYKELKENSGPEGIIKVWDGFTERITESMRQGLAPEYFVDGNAADNLTCWHGLESMFGINGTVNVTDGTQRVATAADLVGYPSDTYAGLSTSLGNYGGSNESGAVWPQGIADSEYDFFSPMIVNYTSTSFGGTAHTWAGQGDEALRYGIINAQRNVNAAGQISTIFLNRDLYRELLNLIDNKEQINVMRNGPEGLVSLGFRNTIQYDGVEITYENAVPSTIGYGVPIDGVTLRSMDDTLFRVEGPEYQMEQKAFIARVSTLSNLQFASPRNFIKWDNIA